MVDVSYEMVWTTLYHQQFAVIGMVNQHGQPRTAGVVYTAHDQRLWFATGSREWKARHLRSTPSASVTVIIPKRIAFLPWIRIPPATVTFEATATERPIGSVPERVRGRLTDGIEPGDGPRGRPVVFELAPTGTFVTYGVGVPLRTMRDTENSRGRATAAPPH